MKRYKIDKSINKEGIDCQVCMNGKVFSDMPKVYKADEFSNNYETHICGSCLSLYKIPRIQIKGLYIDSKGVDITEETINEFNINKEVLTNDNYSYFVLKITQEINKEAKKMWEAILKEKDSFDEFGLHKHIWIKSRPFKTAEGTFQVSSCPICNQATINYKDKVYVDDLNKIIVFIAQQGIKYEREVSFLPVF